MSKPAEEVLHYFMESIDTMELKEGEVLKLKNSLKVAYDDLQKDKNVEILKSLRYENFKIKFHKTNIDSRCNEILEIKEFTVFKGDRKNEFQCVYNGIFKSIRVFEFRKIIKTIISLTSCMCVEVSAYGIDKTIYFSDVMKAIRLERKLLEEFGAEEDEEDYDYDMDYDNDAFSKIVSNKLYELIMSREDD
jgi:hypothetical protein